MNYHYNNIFVYLILCWAVLYIQKIKEEVKSFAMTENAFIDYPKKRAFTLAEILIVMGVIGVVAALTVPTIITYTTEKAWARAMDKFEINLNEATKRMNVNQELTGYATNQDFVNTFKKYIKIVKTCTPANMSECFTSNIYTKDGEIVELSTLTNGAAISQKGNTTPLMGVQFANGTSALLAYKPTCEAIDWFKSSGGTYANTNEEGRQYSAGETTSCLSIVFDVNGFKSPNKIGKDITTLNAKIASCDGTKVAGMCVSDDITYSAVGGDYWQGAKNQCESLEMTLPSLEQMEDIRAAGHSLTGHYWTSTIGTGAYSEYKAYQIVMDSGWTGEESRTISGRKAVCIY